MTQFKDIVFEPNVAIHCPEEWMANELLRYADSKGRRWRFKNKHLEDTFWYVHQENTAYLMTLVAFNDIDEFKRRGFKILHYNDVVIKDETSLDYELIIKGRKAEIGSELWHKDNNGEYKKVTIYNIILHDGENVLIRVENDKKTKTYTYWLYDDMFTKGIDDLLFWEKPIIYQLPDTDGNLSEVKVGQEVWVSNKTINRIWEAKIIGLDKNLGIFLRYINHEYKGHITTPNITGKESFLKVTTNKPHRDFSDCPHWEENPKCRYWGVDGNGMSYLFVIKPKVIKHGFDTTNMFWNYAGYRADLLNENGVVEDWEYSLVKRPEGI